jgi:hypothetical protein
MYKVFRRLSITILLSIFFLFIFNSCRNIFEDSVEEVSDTRTEQTTSTPTSTPASSTPATASKQKITFGGALQVEGALPSKLQEALANPGDTNNDPLETADSRSARPTITAGGNYEYYVRAYTDDGADPVEVISVENATTHKFEYSLELELEHTWKFEAGFRRKAVGDPADEENYQPMRKLLIDYDSKRNAPFSLDLHTATGSLGEQNHTFILCPSQSENGKGSINLSMNVSGVDSVVITAVDEDGIAQTWNGNGTVSLISPTVTEPGIWHIRSVGLTPDNLENTAHQVKSGSYNLTLKFYRNYTISEVDVPIQVYTSYQTISVFDNMITDTWVNENAAVSGVTPVISSSGVFEVNDTIISQSVERTIYVGVPESVHAQIPNLTANDNYTGAPYAPLASLTRAFNKIQATGAGGEYKIYLSGSHTGNFTIPSGINNTKASSIILRTYDGNSNTAVLNGAGGSTLTVDSAVPVTIQNLKITGGSGTSEGSTIKGGGIYIKAGTVTLANGVKVVGNKAYSSDSSIQSMGGGIYVETSATLYMKGTALVGDLSTTPISWYLNSAPSDLTDANYAREGGGIYSKGNLYLGCNSSGETASGYALNSEYGIRHNNSNYGGGINIAGGVFKFASGKIAFNKSGSNGAGIYAGASSEEIKLGAVSIESNQANSDGGGLFIAGGCTVTMDGNASIAKNRASSGGGVNILGTFNMSAGTIGGDSFDYKNFATSSGGVDVDVGSENPHPAGVFNMSGGKISYNESGNNGGGVGISTRDTTKATFNMSGGSIIHNKTPNYGGAVCQAGIFNISGSASIPYVVFADEENPNRICKNDVYVFYDDGTISVNGTFDSTAPEKVATITPKIWSRGKTVISKGSSLSELTTDILNKFDTTDEEYVVNIKGTGSSALGVLQAPIFVAATDTSRSVCSAPDSIEANQHGTKSSPYSSMSSAISQLTDSTVDYEIRVDGIITGEDARANFSGDSLAANSLMLMGAKSGNSDTKENALIHDANLSGSGGSVIILNKSGLTLDIKNLRISGGYGNSTTNGGGITITNGTVKLGDGAIIKGNVTSSSGAGVYVAADGILFMYGNSIIGDTTESLAECQSSTYYYMVRNNRSANEAHQSGGGIYNLGQVYIGYSGFNNSDLIESPMGDGYGVRRNSATGYRIFGSDPTYNYGYGGGIYSGSSATLKIASGTFSYNLGRIGGAFYVGGSNNEIKGSADINHNKATKGGAAFLSNNTTLPLSGNVSISDNEAGVADGDEGASEFWGGAISLSNTSSILELKDKVYIPCTGEKQNDIFLPSGQAIKITGAISLPTSITDNTKKNAYITPSVWTRGTQVLDGTNAALITNNAARFGVSDSEWSVIETGSSVAGHIDAPIYVAGTSSVTVGSGSSAVVYGAGATAANGGRGTKAKPYSTIEEAISQCWKGPNDTASNTGRQINIVGTIPGGQSIPSTITTTNNASMITLKGINSNATLNGGFSNEEGHQGTTLSIGSEVPVKIETLKITGGYNVNGGGMNISAGTVILGDGALIQGNTATSYGGGVYVDSGASLFMYKSALIGESSNINSAPNSEATASNCAKTNGGGIYSKGKVYLGYTGYNGTEPVEGTGANKLTGGVIHNYVTNGQNGNGGGITIVSGTFKMASGNISYNAATGYGGAVWGAGTISGGTIEGNEAVKDGGAVYFTGTLTISSGTFIKNRSTGGNGGAICSGGPASTIEMTGGIIGDATDTSLRNTASLAGGAIYSAGILKMKGAASIPNCGGETLNDVFLASSKIITINGSFDNGNNDVATITPSAWTRSTVVLQASSPVTAITSAIAGKFAVSDPDWEVLSHASKGKLNGVMYVSEGKIVNSDAYSVGYDLTSNDGTKKKPFRTLQFAANQCWDSETTKTVDFKIIVNGTLNGTQTISNVARAKSITVEGMADYSAYTGNSKINGNYSSPADDGSALIINTAVPVTLNKLDITGGKTNGDGGGIRIDNEYSNVTITNTNIYSNYSANTTSIHGGGGIYLGSGTLCLGENTIVHSNTAKNNGGGVLVYMGNLYICGGSKGAIIGYKQGISSRAQNTSVKANRAGLDLVTGEEYSWGNGGGLYAASNTSVYLGYKPPVSGDDPVADTGFNGGLYYNYAKTNGGGAFCGSGTGGVFKMYAGTIQYNTAGAGGGGLYNNAETTIEDCLIADNTANDGSGGGIYAGSKLTINKGTIGRTGVSDAATSTSGYYSNYAKYGGGIYTGESTIGSNVVISYNYATDSGGGITADGNNDHIIGGTISFNGAGKGGGISVSGNGYEHSLDLSATMKTNKAYGSEGGGAIYMSGTGRKVALKSGFSIQTLSSSVTKGTNDILVYYSYNHEDLTTISPTRYTYISIDSSLATAVGSGKYIGLGLKVYSGDPYRAPNGALIFTGSYRSQCATYFKTTDSGHQVLSTGVVK